MAPSRVADVETSSPLPSKLAPLSEDYRRQQIAKQSHNNYHSSSLGIMISNNSVNKTSLHPGGVEYVPLSSMSTADKAAEPIC